MRSEFTETLNNVKGHIQDSLQQESEGKKLAQQSLENYITEELDMEVIDVKELENKHSLKEHFMFTVKSKRKGFNSEYIFVNNHREFHEFTPKENYLILMEIRGEEGTYKANEEFYLRGVYSGESSKNHMLLTTPLDKIMSGMFEDPEARFVVDYLKEKFKGKFNYKYTEESEGNIFTFLINLDDEISIKMGFSNTIEVDFKKRTFDSIQIIFRDVDENELKKEIDDLYLFVKGYFEQNITIDNKYSISDLHDFLFSKGYQVRTNTNSIIRKQEKDYRIFTKLVIGKNEKSYKQIEVSIRHKVDTGQLELHTDYLLRRMNIICDSVDEVKVAIEEMENMLK